MRVSAQLIVGYGFVEHGYAKLARGPESFTDIFARARHASGLLGNLDGSQLLKPFSPELDAIIERNSPCVVKRGSTPHDMPAT